MQQTQNYKLNLIETSDPFSPNPLNENAEKTEAALASVTDRVTILELSQVHMAAGAYVGSNTPQTIGLPFTPKVVYVTSSSEGIGVHAVSVTGSEAVGGSPSGPILLLQENGFTVRGTVINSNNQKFHFMAFG